MTERLHTKKVFISYAWTSQTHVDYVEQLAKRLTSNGIYVVLDQWDLKAGHDKFAFMESSVKDPQIDKVLMIVDKNYTEKADSREGGVGTESIIISKRVYDNVKNDKFIPIVTEFDELGEPYLPIFLETRIYLNFAESHIFEEEYEKLVRLINDVPAKSRPALGSLPSYLTENSVNVYKSGFFVGSVKNQLDKNKHAINRLSSEFFKLFEEELWVFVHPEVRDSGADKMKVISGRLHDFQVLKKNFVDFITIVSSLEYEFDLEYLVSFFEKTHLYQRPRDENSSQWYSADYEVLKIVFQELFVYSIAIAIKNGNFDFAGELLNGTYVFETSQSRGTKEDRSFCGLILIPEIFNGDYRTAISPLGRYYLDNLYNLTKDEFVTADIICHIVCFLLRPDAAYYRWYPNSNAHYGGSRSRVPFKFFQKLESQRFYEKVKAIFNNISAEELRNLLLQYKDNAGQRISFGIFAEIYHVHEFIVPEKIGVLK